MNKKSAIASIIILSIILLLSYCYFGQSPNSETNSTETSSVEESQNSSSHEQVIPPPEDTSVESAAATGFLPTKMEDPKKFELIQKSFQDLGRCLRIKVGSFDKNDNLDLDVLNDIITPDLGDVVKSEDEWEATDIKTKSGEIRRIVIKNLGATPSSSARQLKYYQISPQGDQKELPVSKEQEMNPTETLVASLESDGDIMAKSIARKFIYQNGDDLNVVEKNGQIYSFGLGHEGAFFSCQGFDSAKTISCSCK